MLSEAAASAEMGPWQTRVGMRTCSVGPAAFRGSSGRFTQAGVRAQQLLCSAHRDQEKNLLQVCVQWLCRVKGEGQAGEESRCSSGEFG